MMPENISEHRIPGLELLYLSANRFNLPRDVTAEDRVFGFEQSHVQANQKDIRGQQMPVRGVDGGCLYFYQDFILLGRRFFNLFEMKNIRGTVFCVSTIAFILNPSYWNAEMELVA